MVKKFPLIYLPAKQSFLKIYQLYPNLYQFLQNKKHPVKLSLTTPQEGNFNFSKFVNFGVGLSISNTRQSRKKSWMKPWKMSKLAGFIRLHQTKIWMLFLRKIFKPLIKIQNVHAIIFGSFSKNRQEKN